MTDDILDKAELIDLLIRQQLDKFGLRNSGQKPKYLILNTQGGFLLKSFLGFEDTIELPTVYKDMEVLFSPDEAADFVRVI